MHNPNTKKKNFFFYECDSDTFIQNRSNRNMLLSEAFVRFINLQHCSMLLLSHESQAHSNYNNNNHINSGSYNNVTHAGIV